jgi:hypothetical protein
VLALAVLAAALSLLAQAVPGFDAQGWVLWGREITGGGLGALSTTAYPSWKPLPALVTTPLSLTGAAAPALWLVVARTGAVIAAVLAYRLAARFGGRAAGVAAVVGVVLLDRWWQYAARGAVEPPLAALLLGAVDRHLAGRRGQAAALLALAALGRHEAFALYGLYALVLVRERPARVLALVPGAVVVIALWLAGDWAGSGDPLHGAVLARRAHETIQAQRAGDVPIRTLSGAAGLVVVPLLIGAAAGLVLAWRRREPGLVLIGAAAVAWVGVDVVMAMRGYPASGRFMIPAAALVCVLGAVGLASLARAARGSPARRWALAAALGVLVLPTLLAAPRQLAQQARSEAAFVRAADGLDAAVTVAGGARRIRAEGWTTTQHAFQTHLAWRLGVTSAAVRRRGRVRGPGLAFGLGARPYPALRRAAPSVGLRRLHRVAGWTVWRIAGTGRA